MSKLTIIGGGGVRTPLLIYGLAQARRGLGLREVTLFDSDVERAHTIARLGREIVRTMDAEFEIDVQPDLENAVAGSAYVLNSVRVGGMAARARDERIAIRHGLAGQETTGAGGAAMALRTLPVTLAQARIVEKVAPDAWFINFTNPAGLVTQALSRNTSLRVIGVCDTPSELFHRIAESVGGPLDEFDFDYAGLNHLGWIRKVTRRGEDITERILNDAELLRSLYPGELFDPSMIQALRLIPTEYLFFYYSQRRAYENQLRAGSSRGQELEQMNRGLFDQLRTQSPANALQTYRKYLLQRNASYLKLESRGGSAFDDVTDDYDPFQTATGYHRIALDVMTGLHAQDARRVVLNVSNRGAIDDLDPADVVEVPCLVDRSGARPCPVGRLPEAVRGLVLSVKQYERRIIEAALTGSRVAARLSLLEYPIVGQWEVAGAVLDDLIAADPEYLGYLH